MPAYEGKKIIHRLEKDDLWVISYNGIGGPNVSDKDLGEAHRKFDVEFELIITNYLRSVHN